MFIHSNSRTSHCYMAPCALVAGTVSVIVSLCVSILKACCCCDSSLYRKRHKYHRHHSQKTIIVSNSTTAHRNHRRRNQGVNVHTQSYTTTVAPVKTAAFIRPFLKIRSRSYPQIRRHVLLLSGFLWIIPWKKHGG